MSDDTIHYGHGNPPEISEAAMTMLQDEAWEFFAAAAGVGTDKRGHLADTTKHTIEHAVEEGILTVGSGSVFLIWDDSRAEHGEGPSVTCVYGNLRSAEAHIKREHDAAELEEDDDEFAFRFSIDERSVIG